MRKTSTTCTLNAMRIVVVPYNLEMLVVWGAGHNVQRVSRHGFEMYLAKYISAELTTKIECICS